MIAPRTIARLCIVLLTLISQTTLRAEKLTYTVIHDNKPVGKINIERVVQSDVTQYNFESDVVIKMLLNIHVYDKMDVVFKGNQLIKSYLYRTLNGRVKVRNLAIWDGSQYKQSDKDDEVTTIKHHIHFTTASLYYNEPVNLSSLYSEKFQKMIPVKPAGPKRYRLELPNGNKVFYSYANGRCSLVEAETDWANLKFVINKTS